MVDETRPEIAVEPNGYPGQRHRPVWLFPDGRDQAQLRHWSGAVDRGEPQRVLRHNHDERHGLPRAADRPGLHQSLRSEPQRPVDRNHRAQCRDGEHHRHRRGLCLRLDRVRREVAAESGPALRRLFRRKPDLDPVGSKLGFRQLSGRPGLQADGEHQRLRFLRHLLDAADHQRRRPERRAVEWFGQSERRCARSRGHRKLRDRGQGQSVRRAAVAVGGGVPDHAQERPDPGRCGSLRSGRRSRGSGPRTRRLRQYHSGLDGVRRLHLHGVRTGEGRRHDRGRRAGSQPVRGRSPGEHAQEQLQPVHHLPGPATADRRRRTLLRR